MAADPLELARNPRALLEALAARGESAALLSMHDGALEPCSGALLAERAGRLARGLLTAGVAPGEPVALLGPNGPDWVAIRLGIAASGALALPLDEQLPAGEAARLLRRAGCRLVFAAGATATALEYADPGTTQALYRFADPGNGGARSWRQLLSDGTGPLPEIAPEAPAQIVHTSGTTGEPKSFTLSYANLGANVASLTALGLVRPGDRVLLPLPLDNVYPFVVGLLTPLAAEATVVFPQTLTGPEIARALAASEARLMIAVPRLYAALAAGIEARATGSGGVRAVAFRGLLGLSIALRRHLGLDIGRRLFAGLHRRIGPNLRYMVSGGARLEPELIRTLDGLGWQVLGGYGLAEVGSVFTANVPGAKRVESVGRPLPGRELRIAGADDQGIGEIQLRGPSVFAGYQGEADPDAAVFTADGWFRTGDLGRIDEKGFVHVTGRSKEMIVLSGGRNVFPEALERVYGESPLIAEIAIFEQDGDLKALLRPDTEAIAAAGLGRIEEAVRVAVTERGRALPSYQRISGFALVREPLPRTRLGKYQRFLLPELYTQARSGAGTPPGALTEADRTLIAEPTARRVWDWLQQKRPQRPFGPDSSLQLDLGIDSLAWVELTLELEERFGIRLGEETIAGLVTVRDLLTAAAAGTVPPHGMAIEPEEAQRALLAPPGAMLSFVGRRLHGLNVLVMRLLFRVRAEGLANLPAERPLVLVANHASDLDPLVLAAALPARLRRRLRWGGDVGRLFGSAAGRAFARTVRIFPVDEQKPARSLALARLALADGDLLVWFPESWRSPDGRLQPFFPGIGRLLAETGATAVPVYIDGTFAAMPRWRRVPIPTAVTLRFGKPATVETLIRAGDGENDGERITDALRRAVADLDPGAGQQTGNV